jgi:putative membrane protein
MIGGIMHWMDWFGGGWYMMLLWWVLIVGGIIFVIRFAGGQKSQSTKEDSAIDILKKRYARGDINKEEFERMKRDLV